MNRLALVLTLLLVLPAPTALAATQQIHMSGYAYGPSTVTIKVGDTVTWTNHDQAPHDAVTTAGPAQFRSPMLTTGQSWSFTFSTPGTYSYYCSIHPDMRAQIVVQPAPAAPPPQQQQPQPQQQPPKQTKKPTPTTQQAVIAPPPPETTTTTEEVVAPQPAVASAAPPQRGLTLDPLLLVAGLVAGVATLCLLLIGSRPPAS